MARLKHEAARSLASGSIGASYSAIGTVFTDPIRMLYIVNLTDAALWFSLDETIDGFVIADNGYLILDVAANEATNRGFFIGENQTVYVKRLGVPTTGSVYVSAFYGV